MSDIVPFGQRAAPSAAIAAERLYGIWLEVETFAFSVQMESLTQHEMARVQQNLDAANACIRIVLSDFSNDPAINQLIEQSHGIRTLIETARRRVTLSAAVREARRSIPS
jgi:hypothetical protein